MNELNLVIGQVCQHGQLARSCDICGYQAEIARLQHKLAEARGERDSYRAEWDKATHRNIVLRTTIENLHDIIRQRDQKIEDLRVIANADGDWNEKVASLRQQLAAERAKRCGRCADAALRTPPQKHWCKTLLTAVTDDFGCRAWRQREDGE